MRDIPIRLPHRPGIPIRSLPVLLAAILLALPALPVFAQGGVDDPFAEIVDVRVINLEVVVEEDGERVHGLGPKDFVLEVDGQEVPIEYFTEVRGGTALMRETEQADATVPALAPGEPVGTSYLVFLDEYWSKRPDRDFALKGLIEDLPNLAPEDRMAIVAFDGRQVDLLANWTGSVESLTRTLQRAMTRPSYGLQRVTEQTLFGAQSDLEARGLTLGEGLNPDDPTRFDFVLSIEEEQFARKIAEQVERSVMAASSTLRSFAQPRGRKVMLLYSGGWPYDPARWVVPDVGRNILSADVPTPDELMLPLAETANRLGYTLYTIDVPGLEAFSVDPSETLLSGDLDDQLAVAENRRFIGNDRERTEEATLRELADLTGGQAMINGLRDDAFRRVVADTRSYYWLGFTPQWKGDDSSHEVEVKVREKGMKVRSRENFSDLSRSTEVGMMVESALRFGNPPAEMPLRAEVGRGSRAGWGTRAVPLAVAIPVDALTFLPVADGYVADAEIRIAVLDEEGVSSDIPVVPLKLKLPGPPPEGKFVPWKTELKMRNMRHDLVVSIYDKASGRILSTKLVVPEK